MRVSVVMTTYNGAGVVERQMDSLVEQDYPIHEVLIFDDCSRDDTVKIIREYIEAHHLMHWR